MGNAKVTEGGVSSDLIFLVWLLRIKNLPAGEQNKIFFNIFLYHMD